MYCAACGDEPPVEWINYVTGLCEGCLREWDEWHLEDDWLRISGEAGVW